VASLIEFDLFPSHPPRVVPHHPTVGKSLRANIKKVGLFATALFRDYWFTDHRVLQSKRGAIRIFESADDPEWRFYQFTLKSHGAQLTEDTILFFIDLLKEVYPEASIQIFQNGMKLNRQITDVSPLFALTGKNEICSAQDLIEEEYVLIQSSPAERPRIGGDFIAYPFVYPSRGPLRFAHIVLILVDRPNREIYYYDPQGLTSDDPCRKGFFDDDPDFDMHENLRQIAWELFDNEASVYILENRVSIK